MEPWNAWVRYHRIALPCWDAHRDGGCWIHHRSVQPAKQVCMSLCLFSHAWSCHLFLFSLSFLFPSLSSLSSLSLSQTQHMHSHDFCSSVKINYKTTCKSYSNFLSTCPSFVHNLCHEDVGGSERLRSPCPRHLVCYYCLRINPIHCLNYLDEDMWEMWWSCGVERRGIYRS